MSENLFSFEKLTVYQASRKLVVKVYYIVKTLPIDERFGLCSQLQRSITSVPSNIAEGCGRVSLKEKVHFIEIAYGSLLEAFCQLELCRDLNYISEEILKDIKPQFWDISRLLNALRKSYLTQLNS